MTPSDASNTTDSAAAASAAPAATPAPAPAAAAPAPAADTSPSLFQKIVDEVKDEAVEVWDDDIKPVFVDDVEPLFKNTLLLVERNGGTLLIAVAKDLFATLTGSSWGAVTAQIVTDAKAQGATFVQGEEQLAASTALQIVQSSQAVATPASGAAA